MLVVPARPAVASPLELTETTLASSDAHVTGPALEIGLPSPLTAVAVNCDVWPGRSVPRDVVICTAATVVGETASLPPHPATSTVSDKPATMVRFTMTP